LSVCFTQAVIEHERERGQEQEDSAEFRPKNYRPPHPIGVKGGCSPQNNLKTLSLLNELPPDRNKFYMKKFFGSDCIELASKVNDDGNPIQETRGESKRLAFDWTSVFFKTSLALPRLDIVTELSLRKRASQFLVLHA